MHGITDFQPGYISWLFGQLLHVPLVIITIIFIKGKFIIFTIFLFKKSLLINKIR
jgi:hypothetical protein